MKNDQFQEEKFLELFDKQQEANEKLKDYVLSTATIVGDTKLKELLENTRTASSNFNNFMSQLG